MAASLGQYCINVTDLERSVAFYEALGLTCTSRTEIDQAFEAILQHPTHGSQMQLAQQKDEPFRKGNALWKLYVNTSDSAGLCAKALAAGATVISEPEKQDRWPVTIAFVSDPDGHTVELVERTPWPDTAPTDGPWLGQYCINVTDLEATVKFYEVLGLTCTSRTEIPVALEAILENPDAGSKLQLAQQHDLGGPLDMGAVWKLYVHTDDCPALHQTAVDAGYTSVMEPMSLDRWPVTISFLADPDGYQVELVSRNPT